MRRMILALCTGLVSFMATLPASATTLMPQQRVCPVGGDKYESFAIGSTSYWGIRLDLQRTGVGAYLPYVQCPNGFVVYKDEGEFTGDEIAKLTPVVASPEYQALRTSAPPPVRIVMLEHALGRTDADLRHWLFRAAFESEGPNPEGAGGESFHRKYLLLAVDAYGAWLTANSMHDEEWWFCAVRHADLLRQAGRFDEAASAVGELRAANPPADTVLPAVIAQIEEKATARDAAPAKAEEPRK